MNDHIFQPAGEAQRTARAHALRPVAAHTFWAEYIHVEFDPAAAVTPRGQPPFFTEFLHVSGLFDPWVESCPLALTGANAPSNDDVLGTAVLAILAGYQRYAHISAPRGDTIDPLLLAMSEVSEVSVHRDLAKLDEAEGVKWLQEHLDRWKYSQATKASPSTVCRGCGSCSGALSGPTGRPSFAATATGAPKPTWRALSKRASATCSSCACPVGLRS